MSMITRNAIYNILANRLNEAPQETMLLIENKLIEDQNDISKLNKLKLMIIRNINKFISNFDIIIYNNYYHIFQVCLTSYDFIEECEINHSFINVYASNIFSYGDHVEIFQIYIEFINNTDYDIFGNAYIYGSKFKTLFESALVEGRERTMQFALNNENPLELYEYVDNKDQDDLLYCAFKFDDTISHAIIGNNINCIRTVIDIYTATNTIKDENWEVYFTLAAVYGNMEIINYFLVVKPFMPQRIEDFYNKILKFALCNANIDVVNWALNNGAEYSQTINTFVNDYNYLRSEGCTEGYDDYSDFSVKKECLPDDFKNKYRECMKLIHSHK